MREMSVDAKAGVALVLGGIVFMLFMAGLLCAGFAALVVAKLYQDKFVRGTNEEVFFYLLLGPLALTAMIVVGSLVPLLNTAMSYYAICDLWDMSWGTLKHRACPYSSNSTVPVDFGRYFGPLIQYFAIPFWFDLTLGLLVSVIAVFWGRLGKISSPVASGVQLSIVGLFLVIGPELRATFAGGMPDVELCGDICLGVKENANPYVQFVGPTLSRYFDPWMNFSAVWNGSWGNQFRLASLYPPVVALWAAAKFFGLRIASPLEEIFVKPSVISVLAGASILVLLPVGWYCSQVLRRDPPESHLAVKRSLFSPPYSELEPHQIHWAESQLRGRAILMRSSSGEFYLTDGAQPQQMTKLDVDPLSLAYRLFMNHDQELFSIEISFDGVITLRNLTKRTVQWKRQLKDVRIDRAAFSEDGTIIVLYGFIDGRAELGAYSTLTGKKIAANPAAVRGEQRLPFIWTKQIASGHGIIDWRPFWDIFVPGSTLAMLLGHQGRLYLWDGGTGQSREVINVCTQEVHSFRMSADGTHMAVFCSDVDRFFGIKVFDYRTGKEIVRVDGVDSQLWAVSPDFKKVAYNLGYPYGRIKVVDIATGALINILQANKDEVVALTFSFGSDKLLSVSKGNRVFVWTLPDNSRAMR
jgi:hypothetical protein